MIGPMNVNSKLKIVFYTIVFFPHVFYRFLFFPTCFVLYPT